MRHWWPPILGVLLLVTNACYDASGTTAPLEEGGQAAGDPVPPRRNGSPTTPIEPPPPAPTTGGIDAELVLPASPRPDAATPDVNPATPTDARASDSVSRPVPPDARCCDASPPPPPPLAKTLYARAIQADDVEAVTIYAKSVNAGSVTATIHEDPGEARWNDANTAPDIAGGSIKADVIYVKELEARTVRARVIFAKDVTVTK